MPIKLTEGRTNEELKAQNDLKLPVEFADDITFGSLMWLHDTFSEDFTQPQPQTQMEAP